ncbi:hypothetical protein ACFQAT_26105 [Undibacterium arcticum]|uniref:Uncharacterized protein n=1 Tax=Undibacterium arcticum TaxID=1762892 RepID=A0ABV7F955_9BURK
MKKILALMLAGTLALGAHSAFSSVKSVKASVDKVNVQLRAIDNI